MRNFSDVKVAGRWYPVIDHVPGQGAEDPKWLVGDRLPSRWSTLTNLRWVTAEQIEEGVLGDGTDLSAADLQYAKER